MAQRVMQRLPCLIGAVLHQTEINTREVSGLCNAEKRVAQM
jgi:hypothetical protein